MKTRDLGLISITLIVIFNPLFTKCERFNNGYSDKKQHEIVAKDIGYDILHAYRTTLRNGWEGISEATGRNVTRDCQMDIHKILNDTKLLMQYVDAVGKPKSGYLRGNNVWLGSYSECRDIPDAHYCTAKLFISLQQTAVPELKQLPALWGLCFPSSCTAQDVSLYLKNIVKLVEKHPTLLEIRLSYKNVMCPPVKPSYTTGVKVTIVFCGILLFLCLIGTVVDMIDEMFSIPTLIKSNARDERSMSTMKKSIHESTSNITDEVNGLGPDHSDDVVLLNPSNKSVKIHYTVTTFKESFLGKFFQCFSILQNTAKIFNTDVPPVAIKSINGIRVFSITWVILGHTFGSFGSQNVENRVGIFKDSQLLTSMALLSADFSVDTFFFLSGLLVAYTCFRKLKKNDGSFNWVIFYVHRFWRLTPSYMFVVLFAIYLRGFLTESPFWYMQYTDPICSKYWWTNLLYINNFYPSTSKSCIGWTWYLANDMQFFVITPFLIFPLFKLGWRGVVLPLSVLLESFAITAFIHAHWDLDPLAFSKVAQLQAGGNTKSLREFMSYVYIKPYCRIQVYLVGFFLGYVMYRYSKSEEKTPGWITTLLGWSVTIVLAMLLVYGPHKSILPGAEEWNGAEKVIFGTFRRFLWGLVLVWVVYACHYGAGGLVQKFLSARFWIPLSRLSYNVYLIHYVILILMFVGAKGSLHYDLYTASYYFLANVVLSYGAAYILAVAIEYPCANLEELILKYIRKARKP